MDSSFGEAFARGRGNFGLLRLLAALTVFGSHCYPLAGTGEDPIRVLLHGETNGGSLGVAVFFVISGFLVTRSVQQRTPGGYLWARALRVWPALAVSVVITTFGIGLASTELPAHTYLTNRQTWDWLRNALVFDQRHSLPSVFAFNPFPVVVNGSLWTLPVECSFYLALPILAVAGGLRRDILPCLAAIGVVGWVAAQSLGGLSAQNHGPFVVWDVPLFPALDALLYFLGGAVLWVQRDRVPLSLGLVVAGAVLLWASLGTLSAGFLLHLALPYTVIAAALARPVVSVPWLGDWSYGIYLYAFPVQQAVRLWHGLHEPISPHLLALLALPPVLLCGALSWHLIERPALRLKLPVRSGVLPAEATRHRLTVIR